MTDDALFRLYEEELSFIRRRAGEFAKRYPAVAGRLLIEPARSVDPHVERLIEAFAMIAARTRERLDDEFPELTDALLEILYPQYLAPIPSMTVAQLELDPQQAQVEAGIEVPRHTLLHTRKVDDIACRFRTAYPLRLFPIALDRVEWPAVPPDMARAGVRSVLRLGVRGTANLPLAALAFHELRLFLDELDGMPGVAHALYETLLCDVVQVTLTCRDKVIATLPASAVRPVGFAHDEGVLEAPRRAMLGYRLLQEYFAFEAKFLFVDVGPFDLRAAGGETGFELSFGLRRVSNELKDRLRVENLRYGCTPVVNLFPMHASLRLDHRQYEYQIVPDHRAPFAYEVHSLVEVTSTTPGSSGARTFRPFYAAQHADGARTELAYWHASRRRPAGSRDDGTEMFVSLVDPTLTPVRLDDVDVLHVRAMCTNRDLASRLTLLDPTGDFQVEGLPQITRVRSLRQPTAPVRPDLRGESRWRLVSHLALNHLTLGWGGSTEGERGEALSALRAILNLYDPGRSAVSRQRIEGIVALRSEPTVRVLPGRGPVRGLRIDIELDQMKFTGGGGFLLAAVLERFFAHQASINSFTTLRLRMSQQPPGDYRKEWGPTLGARKIL